MSDDEDVIECCDNCDLPKNDCECCLACGCQWCECCSVCGEIPNYCECCGDCGQSSDDCSCHGHGTSETPPWVNRGIKVAIDPGCSNGWKTVWPEIDASIDPVMAAADFYLLEAVASRALYTYDLPEMEILTTEQENEMFEMLGIKSRASRNLIRKDRRAQLKSIRKTHPGFLVREIEEKAAKLQQELVEILDSSFVPYAHIAIGGEIRHHRAMGGHLSNQRNEAWADWRKVFETVGNDALLDVEKLFIEFGDGNSYGGPAWAKATKILWSRHEGILGPEEYTNKKVFVDRVFSIQHNGGALLDKISWSIKNPRQWGVGHLTDLLDMHSSDVPNIAGLSRVCSPKVKSLMIEYVEAAKTTTPTDPSFEYEKLLAKIGMEPMLVCNACGTNLKYGHKGSCDNFLRPGQKLAYDPNMMRVWWEDEDEGRSRAQHLRQLTDLPFDAWGNPQIDPEEMYTVRIKGNIYINPERWDVAGGGETDIDILETMSAKDIAAGVPIHMSLGVTSPSRWTAHANITIQKLGSSSKNVDFSFPSWDSHQYLGWHKNGDAYFKISYFAKAVKS
jgi:hypothetical protein